MLACCCSLVCVCCFDMWFACVLLLLSFCHVCLCLFVLFVVVVLLVGSICVVACAVCG